MEDYPRTITEFKARFNTEDACYRYIESLRWPEGFKCPNCGHDVAWQTKRGLYQCKKCRRQTSITAGTVFHDSRKPMTLWFEAMWHITSQKFGANALGLQRVLSLGSYHTAWKWLHKLRRVMVRPNREKLSGIIEIDETFIGGSRPGKRGRGAENKTLVIIAVEDTSSIESKGKGIGRIRLGCIDDASSNSLIQFIKAHVVSGSTIRTDGWLGYEPLVRAGYEHTVTDSKGLTIAHLIAALLKRWLLGTYQGAVTRNNLEYYLDEYTFRFNRRKSASRGKLFYRLVQQAVTTAPVQGGDISGAQHRKNSSEIHEHLLQ
jgi:transposase-like protein/predicted RNA-binding Zn-ribbon protein involved in translation (DUF1610 family)